MPGNRGTEVRAPAEGCELTDAQAVLYYNQYKKAAFNMKYYLVGASLVAQAVKNLPAMLQTWVQSLGGEDPPEKEMTTHSSFLTWRIPWTEEPGGLSPGGHKESDTT